MPKLLVVSLNYKTPEMTLKSVRAALTALQGMDADLVVVDNDSGDGSFEQISQVVADEGLPVRVIQSGHNGGFGAGNNVGIQAGMADGARPDYVYILNSDAFPAPDAIRLLADHLDTHPEAGFVGSYIHGPEGEPHVTAFRFPSVWSELEGSARFGPISRALGEWVVPLGVPEQTQKVDWLAGASLMMRMDVLDQIGLFDETFFLYFEETDLCLRAARAGFETHYVRESHVAHIGSVSTGMKRWTRIPAFWLDSRWHYFSKNYGRAYAAMATLAHGLGGALWRLRMVVQRKTPADPPHFLRDLLVHDFKAVMRPLPGKRQAVRGMRPRTALEASVE
ncbi:glycosyltransferase family 2 protein [Tropicibacter naphthalenivorans]|uniref:N-acetylglucosaminyl-diphospho-decaprenol L-rhamnosyltransferase n=1 Tax=Tropicibacter naphthalenivorans TaxID=441103 RepID=A0A0P1GDA7_9RHOB|nr:glycosyltransferase family 2 protein [Tropicibacter naphthalenivorans]CUH79423.1 N-acetylglucosaminyl-diphospho-decaprenol L-rhamnosyltransferase [Tropicibacter naphthalenivorans]SMC72123.1 Glycosyltransferase, GT2 family [Tropicibacter naphthalenivorans]